MKSKISNIAYDEDGNLYVTFNFPRHTKPEIEALKEQEVEVKIDRYREKRSLDANAYAWALIDQLAETMRIPRIEIYRQYIRDIGGISTIVCVPTKNAESFQKDWGKKGLGWQTEEFPSKLEGCTNIICYEGSSEFNTAQMSRLLDLIIQDCDAVGIPTEPIDKVNKRIENWRNK